MIVKLVRKHDCFERIYECLTARSLDKGQWVIILHSGTATFYSKTLWDLYKYTKEGFVNVEKAL